MIRISALPLINSPEKFFETDKILLVDVLKLGTSNGQVPDHPNAFTHDGNVYLKVVLIGSPENMFLNAKKGLPLRLDREVCMLYRWDGDLKKALADRKVYDFTRYHSLYKKGRIVIEDEFEFVVERYIERCGKRELEVT